MEHFFLTELLFMTGFTMISGAVDVTLTVSVSPGTRECFIQELTASSQYSIEYQVCASVLLPALQSVIENHSVAYRCRHKLHNTDMFIYSEQYLGHLVIVIIE